MSNASKADRTVQAESRRDAQTAQSAKPAARRAGRDGDFVRDDAPAAEPAKADNSPKAQPQETEAANKQPGQQNDAGQPVRETPVEDAAPEAADAALALNQAVITAAAQAINSTPEEVAKILDKLEISAVDLTKPSNLSDFIQEFYGAEEKSDLLSVPQAWETFKAVEEAVKQALSAAPEETAAIAEASVKPAEVPEPLRTDEAPKEAVQTSGKAPGEFAAQATAEEPKHQEAQDGGQGRAANGNSENADTQTAKTAEIPVAGKAQTTEAVSENRETITVVTETAGKAPFVSVRNIAAPRQVSQQDVVSQIMDKIKADVKGGVSEVRLILKPETLGEISLKISTQNGLVTAHFAAESQTVKEIIEANFNSLKNSLEESGVKVASLSVSVGQEGNSEAMQTYERERQKSHRRVNKILSAAGIGEAEELSAVSVQESEAVGAKVNYTA
jgi:flagellar hook-length control protein FliK